MSESITPCVFKLKHVPSGRYLVGTSKNPRAIKYHLRKLLEADTHPNLRLQALFTTWGDFEFYILASVDGQGETNDKLLAISLEDPMCLNDRPLEKQSLIKVGDDSLEQILLYKGTPGAYILTHVPTGLYYIGSSGNLYSRYRSHFDVLRVGKHRNVKLQEGYTTPSDYTFQIHETMSVESARIEEQALLNEHCGKTLCCNVGDGANSPWLKLPDRVKLAQAEGRRKSEKWRASMTQTQSRPDLIARRAASNSIQVSIDGIIYQSTAAAAFALGLHPKCVDYRLRSTTTYADWKFLGRKRNQE